MKDQRLITRIATITGLALGAFALSAIAGSWTAPTCAPPNCNTDAPINVGASSQGKVGSFAIGATSPAAGVALDLTGNGFFRNNLAVVGNLILPNGAGPGKVLTTVNSDGVASWQDPASIQLGTFGQLCSTGSSGYSETKKIQVSTLINGKYICADNNGCSLTAWESTVGQPEGQSFLGIGSSGNLPEYDYIRLRQDLTSNRWVLAKPQGFRRGINGDSSQDFIVTGWGGGSTWISDNDSDNTSDDAHDFWLSDNSGEYGYTMTICDL